MRDALLIILFLGLAMGLGTSFGFMFLGIASSKMEKEDGQKFMLNALALSKMGHIGLVLLVLSGFGLMTPYWSTLGSMPLMIVKLVLVLALGALIGILSATGKKAKLGNTEQELEKMRKLGMLSELTAIAIVVLAVLNFH